MLEQNVNVKKKKSKPLTHWIDLQVREEQVLIQVEEPDNEAGQDPAERDDVQLDQLSSLPLGSVASAPPATEDVPLITLKRSSHDTVETVRLENGQTVVSASI